MHGEETISKFLFSSVGSQQTFQHQWILEGEVHDCSTCYSSIDADEPPSQHWLPRSMEQQPQLSKQQQAVLDIIEARQIETFFICDESANNKVHHFLAETAARAVPELLRWMFHNGTQRLEFNLACYVNVGDQLHIFQSGTLNVQHHYDIEECVSVIYDMITQRIENYLASNHNVELDECSINRLRIQLKRIRDDSESENCSMQLPLALQFHPDAMGSTCSKSTTNDSEMASLRAAYVKYQRECHGYFPSNMRVNLFGIQQCQTTKELFMVPHHISETLQQQPNKNFLILNNVMGEFQRFHELPSPSSSDSNNSNCSNRSKHSRSLQCRRCRAQFKSRSRLHIHQQLRCGQDFSVDSIHPDIIEIYEQCLPISRTNNQYACYGITKPKTVMRKGQFVPIECDWRRKCSVQVEHGPCVVICNSQLPASP